MDPTIEDLKSIVFGLRAKVEMLTEELRHTRQRAEEAHVKVEVLKAMRADAPITSPQVGFPEYQYNGVPTPSPQVGFPIRTTAVQAAQKYGEHGAIDYSLGQRTVETDINQQFEDAFNADFGEGALMELTDMVEGERQDDDISKINAVGSGPG